MFVGRQTVKTDDAGNAAFTFNVPGDWPGWWFAATATDLTTGDTSEFGPAVPAAPPLEFTFARLVDTAQEGRQLEAAFFGASGLRYTVLTNADLGTTNWGVFTNLTGAGGTITFRVPVSGAPYMFFWLRQP